MVAFIWFILKRDERAQASEERRDGQWREFLREQQRSHGEALGRLAEEMKMVSERLGGLTTLMVQHDARASEAIAQMMGRKVEVE